MLFVCVCVCANWLVLFFFFRNQSRSVVVVRLQARARNLSRADRRARLEPRDYHYTLCAYCGRVDENRAQSGLAFSPVYLCPVYRPLRLSVPIGQRVIAVSNVHL